MFALFSTSSKPADYEYQKSKLLESKIVQDYLVSGADQNQAMPEDDFS